MLTLDVAGVLVSIPGLLALGGVVGLLAGMFGVGGGFLVTPLLTIGFGVPMEIAVGSGLCQMVGTSLAAYSRHRALKQGEPRVAMLLLGGSLVGVTAGSQLVVALTRLPAIAVGGHAVPAQRLVVQAAYLLVLVGTAIAFLRPGPTGDGPLTRVRVGPTVLLPVLGRSVSALLFAYLGLLIGLLSGLLGIGGGVVLNVLLLHGLAFPVREMAGTGLVLLVVTSVIGTFTHALHAHVHLPMAMVLLLGSSVSAQIGAVFIGRLAPALARTLFAVVVAATALVLAWDLARLLP